MKKVHKYHKYFRADLFAAPPQVYTYRLTNTSYNYAMISTFPNQNEILGILHLKKQPKQGGFSGCELFLDANCVKISAPSIHASLPKNTIFLYPETLSCLDHEGFQEDNGKAGLVEDRFVGRRNLFFTCSLKAIN